MQELEFIVDGEEEGKESRSVMPTGWETVIFVVADEEAPVPNGGSAPEGGSGRARSFSMRRGR